MMFSALPPWMFRSTAFSTPSRPWSWRGRRRPRATDVHRSGVVQVERGGGAARGRNSAERLGTGARHDVGDLTTAGGRRRRAGQTARADVRVLDVPDLPAAVLIVPKDVPENVPPPVAVKAAPVVVVTFVVSKLINDPVLFASSMASSAAVLMFMDPKPTEPPVLFWTRMPWLPVIAPENVVKPAVLPETSTARVPLEFAIVGPMRKRPVPPVILRSRRWRRSEFRRPAEEGKEAGRAAEADATEQHVVGASGRGETGDIAVDATRGEADRLTGRVDRHGQEPQRAEGRS